MSHRQTCIERAAEGSFPYWVAINVDKCTGANYQWHQDFCRNNNLEVSEPLAYRVFNVLNKRHRDALTAGVEITDNPRKR
jgi:hypothetical protein